MKVAISLGAPYAADIKEIQLENQMTYVVEAERLGAESAWSAEAWGHDAITPWRILPREPVASAWEQALCRLVLGRPP